MSDTQEANPVSEDQLSRLRDMYAQWGEAKRELDAIEQDIAVLEFNLGYTAHIGGPALMKRLPTP